MEGSNPAAFATALLSPGINLWRALEARGMDPAPIFRAAGIDRAALRVPGTRVPVRASQRLLRLAEETVGDPSLGIDVARQMHGTALHAVGYAWLSSATLGEACRRFARYMRVLTELWTMRIEEGSGGVRIAFVFAGAQPPAVWVHDWLAAGFVRLCRIAYGEAFTPLDVTVVRSAPDPRAPFDEWFRCPIVWGAARASVLCRREDLAQPLPTSNPDVALANERVALEYLERLDRSDIVAQVRRRILELLPSGPPTQLEIARACAQPAHAASAARRGGHELRRAARQRAARARGRISPAHGLLDRRGRVPGRLRRGVELQPGVPPLDWKVAKRGPAGARIGRLGRARRKGRRELTGRAPD